MNAVQYSTGETLTGKLWRQNHTFFNHLPFYSNIPRMKEMTTALETALPKDGPGESYKALLVKFGKGLDEVNPFSDSSSVDVLLRKAELVLTEDPTSIGPKHASQIWGFLSKFIMLDRFIKALGGAEVYPGLSIPRTTLSLNYLGTGSKILKELNPPTKLLGRFLKTWADREKTLAKYSDKTPIRSSVDINDPANVSLALSRRLITTVKVKNIFHIQAGLELIALALAISSENGGVFPDRSGDFKNVLRRIWMDRIDPQQLEDLAKEIEPLHRSMKNMMEIVFAISPLLALSTHGWASTFIHSSYLLRIFQALGNDRPSILVQVEDCILQAIIALSQGIPSVEVLNVVYLQILLLEKYLAKDDQALMWFSFSDLDDGQDDAMDEGQGECEDKEVQLPSRENEVDREEEQEEQEEQDRREGEDGDGDVAMGVEEEEEERDNQGEGEVAREGDEEENERDNPGVGDVATEGEEEEEEEDERDNSGVGEVATEGEEEEEAENDGDVAMEQEEEEEDERDNGDSDMTMEQEEVEEEEASSPQRTKITPAEAPVPLPQLDRFTNVLDGKAQLRSIAAQTKKLDSNSRFLVKKWVDNAVHHIVKGVKFSELQERGKNRTKDKIAVGKIIENLENQPAHPYSGVWKDEDGKVLLCVFASRLGPSGNSFYDGIPDSLLLRNQEALQILHSTLHPIAHSRDIRHNPEEAIIEYNREGVLLEENEVGYERTGVTHLVHAWHMQGNPHGRMTPSQDMWGRSVSGAMAVRQYFQATQGLARHLAACFEAAFPEYYKAYSDAFAAGRWLEEDPGPWLGRAIVWKLQVNVHQDGLDEGPTAAFNCGQYTGGNMYIPDLGLKLRYRPGDLLIFFSGRLYHKVGRWKPCAQASNDVLTPGRIGNVFFFPKLAFDVLKDQYPDWNRLTSTGTVPDCRLK